MSNIDEYTIDEGYEKTERAKAPFIQYLREDRLPHIFCPGCGNGTIINTFFKGMEKANIDFENIAMVSGIGCSSRIPGYVKCDSLHTTHGRSIAFATGSGCIIIPQPPPKGISSTFLCLSFEKSLMFITFISIIPFSFALPIILSLITASHISGNNVIMSILVLE